MPHSEAQAWWAEVQHVRETIERRRAGLADSAAPRDAATETRFERRVAEPLATVDELDWAQVSPGRTGGRSDHTVRTSRVERTASRPRRPGLEPVDHTGPRGRRDDDHAAADGPDRVARTHRQPPVGSPGAALAPPTPRRTVEITGRTIAAPPVPRLVEVERRRPPRRTVERVGPRPDRVALWAVLLGFFLILVAATSSRAATAPVAHGHPGAQVALHAPAR
jgi:hypothetical protein